MKRLLLFLLLVTCGAIAQVSPQIQGSGAPTNPCYNGGQQYYDQTNHILYNCSIPGQNWTNIGVGNPTVITTACKTPTVVASLAGVCGATKGTIATVTDGASASDCTSGGGSTAVTCLYGGASWAAVGGGGGSGTVSANNGSAGAMGTYAAASGSTTIGPDTLLTDASGTLTYTGTAGITVAQPSNTGTTNTPALNITTTLNNAGLNDNIISVAATNTASGTSKLINLAGGAAGATNEFWVDMSGNVAANAFGGLVNTTAMSFCGGLASAGCGPTNQAGQTGAAVFQGGSNSNTGASAKAGPAVLQGGFLTAAAPNAAALPGVPQMAWGGLKGTAVAAIGDVVCATTTAFTVTDCSHTGPAVTIVGIAGSTSNPIIVFDEGLAIVKTDGAIAAIGDILCMGTTTDGLAHDNGTAVCATAGTTIGVVVADSGTILQLSASGATAGVAMSTTLPLVQLHIGK